MPKQIQRSEMNSFLGGLATEFTSLNSPPNTASDIANFELNRDGMVNRRLGMDFEPSFGYQDTGYSYSQITNLGFNSYKWDTVGGDPLVNFTVFQIGKRLMFYNSDVINFSGTGFVGNLTLDSFDETVNFSIADVEGRLVVVSGNEFIAVITYAGGFSVSYERILTRDYWGLEETIEPPAETDQAYRPVDNPQHRYNLMNQSWGIPRKDDNGNLTNPIDYFISAQNHLNPNNPPVYTVPSNSEQVWTGLQMQPVAINSATSQQPFERMYRNLWDDSLGSKFITAKGYFIIDALRRGQARQDAITSNTGKYPAMALTYSFPTDYSSGGATCVTQYAGRFFYGGFNGTVIGGDARSPNYTNFLFFSQLIKSTPDIIKCYQEGDPTSRDNSDVVDTDGGFVRVSGAQQIVAIRQLGTALLIFATNGVWLLTGGTVDSGFSATNYKISQISTFGITSINSLIVEGDTAFFWAKDGIYEVARNQLGDFAVTSITLKTIQKFYQAIPNLSKINSIGRYDEVNKKLRWVWTEGTLFTDSQETHELVLDTALNAFSHNTFGNTPTNAVYLAGIFQTRTVGTGSVDVNVYDEADLVLVGTNGVTVGGIQTISNTQYVRYFTLVNIGGEIQLTVSYLYNTQFLDWFSLDGVGVDAKAFLTTGAQTGGDQSTQKWIPYITFSFLRTENGSDTNGTPLFQSGCMFNVSWAFSNQQISNKISTLWEAYRYRKGNYAGGTITDTGFEVLQTRNKVRGNGRAFQLYLESEPGKDLKLLGWNMSLTVNNFS